MKKSTLLVTFFISINTLVQSQFQVENSTWITNNKITFKVKQNEIEISGFEFITEFEFIGDTLHLIHDFSHVIGKSVDGKTIARKDFELPDSYFLFSQNHKDSITLTALNPTAIHIVNIIKRNFNYNLTEKEVINWELSQKKPKAIVGSLEKNLNLYNINTITKKREIKSLKLSTVSFGWNQIYFLDIEISSSYYFARTIEQNYNNKEKCIYSYYSGILDSIDFLNLEKLFGQTNFPDDKKESFNQVFATHDIKFIIEVKHNKGKTIVEGNRESLPDYAKTFFDAISKILKEKDETTEIKNRFRLSKLNKN